MVVKSFITVLIQSLTSLWLKLSNVSSVVSSAQGPGDNYNYCVMMLKFSVKISNNKIHLQKLIFGGVP